MNLKVSQSINSTSITNNPSEHTALPSVSVAQINKKLILLASFLMCSCSLQDGSNSKVVVVDHFKTSLKESTNDSAEVDTSHLMDIDQDSSHDISHGDLVSKVIKINGAKYVTLDGGLESIKDIPIGTRVVNISLSVDLSFKDLSQKIGIRVTPDNIKSIRGIVLDRLEALPNNEPDFSSNIANTVKNVRRLEALAREGTVPVVAAGNMGSEHLNLLTLGAGTVVVGGLDEQGNRHPDSGNNSLVKEWRPFSIQPRIVEGGMSLHSNQQVDLKWSGTTSKGKYLELAVVSDKILEKSLIACEQVTLQHLARQYKKLGIESGMYRPKDLMFGAVEVESHNSESLIMDSKFSDNYCFIAFKNAENPHIWIITGERMSKVPQHAIKLIDPEVTVKVNQQSTQANITEKELAQILINAGLKDGNYDLVAIKDSLENNSKNHFIRIKLSRNALIIRNNKYHFANIRGEKPAPIEGTSFATPVVAAELAKQLSRNQ